MWELKTAADLRPRATYVRQGDYHASARDVTSTVVPAGDTVTFAARARWLWGDSASEELVTLDRSAAVYIHTCTCNGMTFICNRWTFTGECSCVHHPLPRETAP